MHYVIKGPRDGNQYLCDFANQPVPQWWGDRLAALSFKTAEAAYDHLATVQREHPTAGSYSGRAVRVLLPSDRKVREAHIRAHRDELVLENHGLKAKVKVLETRLAAAQSEGATHE
jgi:hypothetical protein